jgi:hypothetical protein
MPVLEPAQQVQIWSPKRQVQIWSRGNVVQWRAVTFTRDSVSGIPYPMSAACADCRNGLRRLDVDSIRLSLSNVHKGRTIVVAAAAGLAIGYLTRNTFP